MGNCLVTKLKGVVDNDNLRKFGEFFLYTKVVETFNQISNSVTFVHSVPITVRIIEGNGFLVDSDMSSNPVKTKTLEPTNGYSTIYLTNAVMKLGVSDIADIIQIKVSEDLDSKNTPKALIVDFDEFEYYENHFSHLYLNYATVKGNIKNLRCYVDAYIPTEVQCVAGCSQLHGSVNDLNGKMLPPGGSGISYSSGIITGDIVQYANATPDFSQDTLKGPNVKLTGNLSLLSAESKLNFITQTQSPDSHFTYTQSNIGRCQIHTENVNLGDDLERYILDTAAIAQTDRWVTTYLNMIIVYGNIDVTKPDVVSAIDILRGKNLMEFRINGVNYNA